MAAEIDLTQPTLLIDKSPQLLFDELRSAEGIHASLSGLSDEALWQSVVAVQSLSVEMPVLDGVLRGQVRNGTTGELVPNSELTLYGLSPTGEIMRTETTTADENGEFAFEKLSREHTVSYAVEGEYNGISYISQEPTLFVPDEMETQLDLVVYESTDDPSAVSQSRLHRIIAFDQGEMVVADVHIFINEGDRTFVGKSGDDGQPQTVEIALPPGALEPNFQPATVRQVGSAYASSQPIIPGEEAVVSVSYSVPFDGDSLSLTMPLLYDVPVINILAAEQGETISSNLLSDQGVQNFQGNNYHILSGADLKAGQSLVLELGNLDQVQVTVPQTASGSNAAAQSAVNLNQTVLLWTLLGMGLAAIAFSLYYSNRTELQTVQQTATLQQQKDHLLGKLKALESLYHTGEINEQAYQQVKNRNRASLKQILAELHEREL